MGEGRRNALTEVSNLPRARTFTNGSGIKRTITPSGSGGSPTKRLSSYSNRNASARRGTVSSIPAPPMSTGARRQTEYERKTDGSSNSALSGRVRATMTFAQASTRPRPQQQLRTSTASASSEASQMEQCEKEQKIMQMMDDVRQHLAAGKSESSEIQEELKLARVKLREVEERLNDAKKESAEKTNQLNEAELEVKTLELELMQRSSVAGKLLVDCRRKATAAEEDVRKWTGKVDAMKSARSSLEKQHAYQRVELEAKSVDVDRLKKDMCSLRRKQDVCDAERGRYLAEIRQLEDSLQKVIASQNQAVSEFDEGQARIRQLESDLNNEELNVGSLKNELLALGAQHEQATTESKQKTTKLRKLRDEEEMRAKTFEKQLSDAMEKNAEIQEKFISRVDELEKSLAHAEESSAEADQKAIADEKSLSTHSAEVSRIKQENRLIRIRVESKKREISVKDAKLGGLEGEITRLEGQTSETEKIIARLRSELQRLKCR